MGRGMSRGAALMRRMRPAPTCQAAGRGRRDLRPRPCPSGTGGAAWGTPGLGRHRTPTCVVAGPVHVGLVHRRLSFLDLSAAGHGPMCDANADLWITYNGEVYNYVELRADLQALGEAFTTGTDTEVILAAYRRWGRECLQRFLAGRFGVEVRPLSRAHADGGSHPGRTSGHPGSAAESRKPASGPNRRSTYSRASSNAVVRHLVSCASLARKCTRPCPINSCAHCLPARARR